jgi:hypothetical protein
MLWPANCDHTSASSPSAFPEVDDAGRVDVDAHALARANVVELRRDGVELLAGVEANSQVHNRAAPLGGEDDRAVARRHPHRFGADDEAAPVPFPDVRHPEEGGDPLVHGTRPHLFGRTVLDDSTRAHYGDAFADRERLADVVGDMHDRKPEPLEELGELVEEPLAKRPVERAERLVEKEHAGLRGKRSREGDALKLATGKRPDRAPLEATETDELEELGCPPFTLRPRRAGHARPEGDVPGDVAVREERALLEHESDAASVGRHACEVPLRKQDPARVRTQQTRDGAEERALAAAARPEHGEPLALVDLEVDAGERRHAVEGDREPLDAQH